MTAGGLARAVVAVGLTLFLFWRSDPAAVLNAGRGADLGWFAAALFLVVFDRALMAYRWVVLLRAVEPRERPPLGVILRVFFVSTFVGTFLPSVGGDVVRAYSLARYGVDGARSAASVMMDRVMGVASIFILGLAGVWFAGPAYVDRAVVITLSAALLFCGGTALVVFSEQAALMLRSMVSRLPATALARISTALVDATRRYHAHRGALLNVLGGSVIVQVLRVVQAYCLGRALGIPAPLAVYFAFVPLILLIMLLPVTVNGLGTSQLAFVWFFGRVGVPDASAFALSVLFVALGVMGNLPGAFLYATGRGPARSGTPV